MRRARKKKNGAKSLKRCLWSLLVGGCARDRQLQVWNSVLFTYFWFLVLQNHGCCENWGEMEGNWGFLVFAFKIENSELNSPKILRFEFLYVCLCESLVFYSDGLEYLVLYLDYMNESLDICSGWICVVFAICMCSSLQLSLRVRLKVWIFLLRLDNFCMLIFAIRCSFVISCM